MFCRMPERSSALTGERSNTTISRCRRSNALCRKASLMIRLIIFRFTAVGVVRLLMIIPNLLQAQVFSRANTRKPGAVSLRVESLNTLSNARRSSNRWCREKWPVAGPGVKQKVLCDPWRVCVSIPDDRLWWPCAHGIHGFAYA